MVSGFFSVHIMGSLFITNLHFISVSIWMPLKKAWVVAMTIVFTPYQFLNVLGAII